MFLNNADDDDTRALVSQLAKMAESREKDGFRAFVYFLDGTPEQLKKLNEELKADSIALALIPKKDRDKTLELYKINEKAESTVLVYLNRNITVNMVNFDPSSDSEKLEKAINEVCDGD